MAYYVYGKRPDDARFAPLNGDGVRCSRKIQAMPFATREDAEYWKNRHKFQNGIRLEIRKG